MEDTKFFLHICGTWVNSIADHASKDWTGEIFSSALSKRNNINANSRLCNSSWLSKPKKKIKGNIFILGYWNKNPNTSILLLMPPSLSSCYMTPDFHFNPQSKKKVKYSSLCEREEHRYLVSTVRMSHCHEQGHTQ